MIAARRTRLALAGLVLTGLGAGFSATAHADTPPRAGRAALPSPP